MHNRTLDRVHREEPEILGGLAGYAIAVPGLTVRGVTFDVHTLLFASLALLCGYQAILFAILSETFAVAERLLPPDPLLERLFSGLTLEKGLLAAAGALCGAAFLLGGAIEQWRAVKTAASIADAIMGSGKV